MSRRRKPEPKDNTTVTTPAAVPPTPKPDATTQPEVVINQPVENAAIQPVGTTAIEEWDFGDAKGAGRETVTSAFLKIGILKLLQKGSPGIDDPEKQAKFGPLFVPGNFQDPITGKCYDGKKGILVQFLALIQEYIEWEPDQGGIVDVHQPLSEVVKDAKKRAKAAKLAFGEYNTVAGNDLVEYQGGLAMVEDEASGDRFFTRVSVKSSGIPNFQNYISTIHGNSRLPNGAVVPSPSDIPLFSYVARMTNEFKKDDKYTWFVAAFAPANGDAHKSILPRKSPRFADAQGYYTMFNKGLVETDYDTMDSGKTIVPDGVVHEAEAGAERVVKASDDKVTF